MVGVKILNMMDMVLLSCCFRTASTFLFEFKGVGNC